jgi:hypothetical protein
MKNEKNKLFPILLIIMMLILSGNVDLVKGFVSIARNAATPPSYISLLVLKAKKLKPVPAINIEGKGFAPTSKPEKRLSDILKKTEAGYVRKYEGHYKRLVDQHSEVFDVMLLQVQMLVASFNANDIYARSEQSSKTFFIGRIIYPLENSVTDAIKTIEVLLSEFAKTLQPVELGSLQSTKYPQLLYSRMGFTEEKVFNDYEKEAVEGKEEETVENEDTSSTSSICRYYHFNQESKFLDFHQIGFQPVKDLSDTRKYRGEEVENRRKRMTKYVNKVGDGSKFLLTHDDGRFWTSEERKQVQQLTE